MLGQVPISQVLAGYTVPGCKLFYEAEQTWTPITSSGKASRPALATAGLCFFTASFLACCQVQL